MDLKDLRADDAQKSELGSWKYEFENHIYGICRAREASIEKIERSYHIHYSDRYRDATKHKLVPDHEP